MKKTTYKCNYRLLGRNGRYASVRYLHAVH